MPRVTTLSSLTTLTLFVPTVSGTISVSPWILNTPQDYITALGVTYTNSSSNGLITTIGSKSKLDKFRSLLCWFNFFNPSFENE